MIESTFVLLKGIGEKTERRWWDTGVVAWHDFLAHPDIPGLSHARKHWYDIDLARARDALLARDSRYFAAHMRPRDHWRLYPLFRQQAVYLDIETTGGLMGTDAMTVVGLSRDGQCVQLVEGIDLNLGRLNDLLAGTSMLVTFFGSVFDGPFLKRQFPTLVLPPLHLDLCFAARRVGLTGGLKSIERQLDITRPADLAGLDGWDAVRLWRQWEHGNAAALDRLLRYNAADTEHLYPLADQLYERLACRYGPPHIMRSVIV